MRNWEELNKDCLANIFGRVGLESLVWSLPFVCKNWYTASLDPHCWMLLDFQSVISSKFVHKPAYQIDRSNENDSDYSKVFDPMREWYHNFPLLELAKLSVDRSQGIATEVVLNVVQRDFEDVMTYISNGCPMLKKLLLPEFFIGEGNIGCVSKLIRNWKKLEHLTLPCGDHFHDIISEISAHCKNFTLLTITGRPRVTDEAAATIVTLLPNIRCLNLSGSDLDRKTLVRILDECKKLEFLDVSHCEGFDADDEEILKMASHIQTFLANGSVVEFDDSVYDFLFDYNEDELLLCNDYDYAY